MKAGYESTICDDDIVFLQNPFEVLKSRTHFELGMGHRFVRIDQHHDYNMNVGFMHVIPATVSL